jgi:hypothetical protein
VAAAAAMLSATTAVFGLALLLKSTAALTAAGGAGPPPLRLALDPASAPAFRTGAAFFTAAPNGFNNNLTLVPPLLSDLQRLGEAQLLGWNGVGQAQRTEPLVDTVSTVRLLGGWGSSPACQRQAPIPGCVPTPREPRCCARNGTREACCPPASWSDIAYRQPDGMLGHRWSREPPIFSLELPARPLARSRAADRPSRVYACHGQCCGAVSTRL